MDALAAHELLTGAGVLSCEGVEAALKLGGGRGGKLRIDGVRVGVQTRVLEQLCLVVNRTLVEGGRGGGFSDGLRGGRGRRYKVLF